MRLIPYAAVIAIVNVCCTTETRVAEPPELLLHTTTTPQYEIVKLPSLGGTVSRGTSINNRGQVAGFSQLAGNTARHAVLWREGAVTDLGTLGGTHSSVVWPGLNERGMVAGISETAALDTLHEQWSCTAFLPTLTGHTCVGFVWENGVMTALPTLGGDQGFATGVTNRGLVVGWAETRVHDPTCNAPQVLQFRAVMWEPRRGGMHQLRPLPGDSASAATAINERGQAVGISGACDVAVGRFSARRAVLWDHGRVIDLGTLGGDFWHTPMDINERGDVVGFSNPTGVGGGVLLPNAFLWSRHGGIRNLGTLPGDTTSQALGINGRGQVVGFSTGRAGSHAVLWQDGVPTDLNSLVGPGFPDVLVTAQHINDDGTITGRLREAGTGATLAFVAHRLGGGH